MGKLKPLVEKEIKDLLRDPRIYIGLIVPIIMLPLMGMVFSIAVRGAMEVAIKELNVAILDYDGTEISRGFTSLLVHMGLNISTISAEDLGSALEGAKMLRSKALIVIPKGFEEGILNFGRSRVDVYAIMESVGIGVMGAYAAVDGTLKTCSDMLSAMLISKLAPGVEPEAIRNPLNITRYTMIKDRVVQAPPGALFGQFMMGYGAIIPMVLFILAITVTQIAATATAVENEEKTLETLLTFPVTRYDILMAKLLGSSIVAILGSILFIVGFLIYFERIFIAAPGLEPETVGIFRALPPPTPEAYVVLALSLALSIIFMTAIGIAIGALSSDVRMSGSLLGVAIIPVLIPSILIMYGDLRALPLGLQLLTYALPTSYPMIVAREMITSTIPIEVLYGIPYSAILTIIVLYATSKLLAPERLLTLQYKLRLKRMKVKQVREIE